MKKSLRILAVILTVAVIATVMSACKFTSWSAITYDVSTGDKIKLQLDTTGGYSQDGKNPFTIKQNDKDILQGTFIDMDTYNSYVDNVNSGSIEILEQGIKDSNSFIFYTVDNGTAKEYDFIVMIEGSNTGVLLGGITGQEEVRNCFSNITFTVEK